MPCTYIEVYTQHGSQQLTNKQVNIKTNMQQQADTQPEAQQPHELEYLENISQHLNEEFLHLKTLQIPQLGGNSGTPFHVLWRPVNEEEMEAAMSAVGSTTCGLENAEARGRGEQSKRHRHA